MNKSTTLALAMSSMMIAMTAQSALALDKTDLKCRSSIAKAYTKAVTTADKVIAICHKLRNAGKNSVTDCNDIAQADAAKSKYAKISGKLVSTIQKKCTDAGASNDVLKEFISCPVPCDSLPGVSNPIGSYAELAQCLSCLAGAEAGSHETTNLGNPDPSQMSSDDMKCHLAIGKGYGKHLKTLLKSRTKCQLLADKSGNTDITTCSADDNKGKIAGAVTKAEALLDKLCAAADLTKVGSCATTNLTDLKACLLSNGDTDGLQIFKEHYGLDPTICPQRIDSIVRSGTGHLCSTNADCEAGTCDLTLVPSDPDQGRCKTETFLEIGWTGLAHTNDLQEGYMLSGALTCPAAPPCGTCTVDGIALDGPQAPLFTRCAADFTVQCTQPFQLDPACDFGSGPEPCVYVLGPPLPTNNGNNPTCAINTLSADISGTVNVDDGSSELSVPLLTLVYTSGSIQTRPCPYCVGDDVPLDGVRNGTCWTGEAPDGRPCDIQGYEANFAGKDENAGVSLDCAPDPGGNISGLGLIVNLDFTTGTSQLPFETPCTPPNQSELCACAMCSGDQTVPCRNDGECALGPCTGGTCAGNSLLTCSTNADCNLGVCNAQGLGVARKPNDCSTFAECNPDPDRPGGEYGECSNTFIKGCDGVLRANGKPLITCNSDATCISTDCGGGSSCGLCTLQDNKPCYLNPITSTGTPDLDEPTLTATFCLGPTTSTSINQISGTPGPARVKATMNTTKVY